MKEKTEEWLHKTRQLDRKHALRGGPVEETGAFKQTSMTVAGALVVIAVLIASPLRLSESRARSVRIVPGSESRISYPPESDTARAAGVVGAALPVAVVRPTVINGIPTISPHVPIWTQPHFSSGIGISGTGFTAPSVVQSRPPNLVGR